MVLTPFLRNPITDITGSVMTRQHFDRCAGFEMRMLDCLEAYGADRGRDKCKDFIDDFYECSLMHKQMRRIDAMKLERWRQYQRGERTKETFYADPPKLDSY